MHRGEPFTLLRVVLVGNFGMLAKKGRKEETSRKSGDSESSRGNLCWKGRTDWAMREHVFPRVLA